MAKQAIFIKFFASHGEAFEHMRLKNKAARAAGNKEDCFCVVDGPEDNFAVADLDTAIAHGQSYEWSL